MALADKLFNITKSVSLIPKVKARLSSLAGRKNQGIFSWVHLKIFLFNFFFWSPHPIGNPLKKFGPSPLNSYQDTYNHTVLHDWTGTGGLIVPALMSNNKL